MKVKLFLVTLVGVAATSLAVYAQTNTAAGTDVATTASDSTTTVAAAAAPAATNDVAQAAPATPELAQAATATNAPAADAAAATAPTTNAPATDTTAAAAPATNAPTADATTAAAPATSAAPTPTGADTNAAAPGALIPLIVMDDVPLTDAIKNLARQAGLNYMLDPKVSFGQVGPDGRPAPQPNVSIRWENVTAQQALSALLNNYSLQLVEDPKSKIARIMVKDPAAPDPLVTKVIQLKFSSPSNIVTALNNVLTDKRSKVVPDVRTSQLVVLATEKDMVEVDNLVEKLDTQTRQVLIEARLMETQFNPATTKGVDWTGTLAAQNVTFGNGATTGTATTTRPGDAGADTTLPSGRTVPAAAPFQSVSTILNSVIGAGGLTADTARGFNPETFFLNADGVHAVLSFLNTYTETKVISTPRTVTLDNEMAVIEVGTMYPIVNVTAGTVQVSGGSQITYSNLTVKLEVTPRISANNYVNLKVHPSVLRLGPQVKTTVAGVVNSVNEFLTRNATTSVMVPSGNTLVMGGLISDEIDTANVKVPVLGDIPGLGLLFRWDSKNRNKQNLLVFLTPTIVADEDFQPTPSSFLKTPVPATDSLERDWSSWDSGKPKDWSDKGVKGSYDESVKPTSSANSSTTSDSVSANP
jgi:type II secretory pathway component GspD/PulD (secretin)